VAAAAGPAKGPEADGVLAETAAVCVLAGAALASAGEDFSTTCAAFFV
jgi:hypothetical protein